MKQQPLYDEKKMKELSERTETFFWFVMCTIFLAWPAFAIQRQSEKFPYSSFFAEALRELSTVAMVTGVLTALVGYSIIGHNIYIRLVPHGASSLNCKVRVVAYETSKGPILYPIPVYESNIQTKQGNISSLDRQVEDFANLCTASSGVGNKPTETSVKIVDIK